MKSQTIIILLILSFLGSVTLGMLDYESESLYHLSTSEPGNLIALGIYTALIFMIFAGIYWIGWFILWLVKQA